jgi:hypothetical protein
MSATNGPSARSEIQVSGSLLRMLLATIEQSLNEGRQQYLDTPEDDPICDLRTIRPSHQGSLFIGELASSCEAIMHPIEGLLRLLVNNKDDILIQQFDRWYSDITTSHDIDGELPEYFPEQALRVVQSALGTSLVCDGEPMELDSGRTSVSSVGAPETNISGVSNVSEMLNVSTPTAPSGVMGDISTMRLEEPRCECGRGIPAPSSPRRPVRIVSAPPAMESPLKRPFSWRASYETP